MNQHALSTALAMLDRFEAEDALMPQDAERLVSSVLRVCGHDVTESGFVGGDSGADCYFDATLEGRRLRIAVEVKTFGRPAQRETVNQAHAIAVKGGFDRAWIVSRSGFSQAAIQRADTLAGVVDLYSPADLRNWVAKYTSGKVDGTGSVAIIRAAMRDLAKQIALDPSELRFTEWRDLERVLREVFEGIGFNTHLTRPGKDGGFDLELSTQSPEGRQTYLVEVKHWAEQKPGAVHLTKLIKVSIERAVDGAILLSTSGFTSTIYSGLLEIGPPVRLGAGDKVIALCQTYYRLSTGYWLEESRSDALFSGTALPAPPSLIV